MHHRGLRNTCGQGFCWVSAFRKQLQLSVRRHQQAALLVFYVHVMSCEEKNTADCAVINVMCPAMEWTNDAERL